MVYGKKAADYTVESGKNVYSSAQDGTLQQKTAEKAQAAGNAIGSFGQSLYSRFQSYTGASQGNS